MRGGAICIQHVCFFQIFGGSDTCHIEHTLVHIPRSSGGTPPMSSFSCAQAALSPVPCPARGGSASSSGVWGCSGFTPVALKPIGRSPAYYPPNRVKPSDGSDGADTLARRSPIAKLFGGNSDLKAEVAKLEYELECSRNHVTELGLELREAKTELAKVSESRELYKERCKLQDKEIFALERQNEETKKGFDTGMAVAKRQIKMLEGKLKDASK